MFQKKSIKFSKLELSAINEIRTILEKYKIKYFKITKDRISYKNGALKYYINEVIEDERESDEELELNFTDYIEEEEGKSEELEDEIEDERKSDKEEESVRPENVNTRKRKIFQTNNQNKRIKENDNSIQDISDAEIDSQGVKDVVTVKSNNVEVDSIVETVTGSSIEEAVTGNSNLFDVAVTGNSNVEEAQGGIVEAVTGDSNVNETQGVLVEAVTGSSIVEVSEDVNMIDEDVNLFGVAVAGNSNVEEAQGGIVEEVTGDSNVNETQGVLVEAVTGSSIVEVSEDVNMIDEDVNLFGVAVAGNSNVEETQGGIVEAVTGDSNVNETQGVLVEAVTGSLIVEVSEDVNMIDVDVNLFDVAVAGNSNVTNSNVKESQNGFIETVTETQNLTEQSIDVSVILNQLYLTDYVYEYPIDLRTPMFSTTFSENYCQVPANLQIPNEVNNHIDHHFLENVRKERETEIKKRNRLIKDKDLMDSILTKSTPDYRKPENLVYLENNTFSNILENCITAEIRTESQKCELLQNYFRTGAFLNYILEVLKDDLSMYPERSIVTGMIKGTGISSMFMAKYGNYEELTHKKALRLYNISLRVYEVYSCFPNPMTQIYRATDNVSPDALMKVGGGKEGFKVFINELKRSVECNYEHYSFENPLEKNMFDFNLITEDIKSKVKIFSENPCLSLDSV